MLALGGVRVRWGRGPDVCVVLLVDACVVLLVGFDVIRYNVCLIK